MVLKFFPDFWSPSNSYVYEKNVKIFQKTFLGTLRKIDKIPEAAIRAGFRAIISRKPK
jgi:hypothetical protein